MRAVALALVHHPVLGRSGEVLTTTITTLDLHDLARCARVYELLQFYAIHPLASQRRLAERIREHWTTGSGSRRIPDRAEALALLRTTATLEEAARHLGELAGCEPVELWTTAARLRQGVATSFGEARERLAGDGGPVLLCFGTGWGLAEQLIDDAHCHLEPIGGRGQSPYNHLSVRAACAIVLDRLLG